MSEPDKHSAFFHLTTILLANGSRIQPGNYGRLIQKHGWAHNAALREMNLEAHRAAFFQDLPSRLKSNFIFPTLEEARRYQKTEQGFEAFHLLYRVCLADPGASTFVTDWRLINLVGPASPTWADAYWGGVTEAMKPARPIEGIDYGTEACREVLTLSDLHIEERLD